MHKVNSQLFDGFWNQNLDTAIITGNIGKIGIGFVSCFFDVILLVQHFCLYGKNNDNKLNEAIDEREKDKPEIAGSGWLESVKSIADSKYGFSPMASAVIYHAPKGDLMNSTASFRDVFAADINTSQVRHRRKKTGSYRILLRLVYGKKTCLAKWVIQPT